MRVWADCKENEKRIFDECRHSCPAPEQAENGQDKIIETPQNVARVYASVCDVLYIVGMYKYVAIVDRDACMSPTNQSVIFSFCFFFSCSTLYCCPSHDLSFVLSLLVIDSHTKRRTSTRFNWTFIFVFFSSRRLRSHATPIAWYSHHFFCTQIHAR